MRSFARALDRAFLEHGGAPLRGVRLRAAGRFPADFAVAALAALLPALALRAWANLAAPYPLEPSDAGMLSSAWAVAQGEPIFNVLDAPPYVFNIHNFLFIHLSALAIKLGGESPFWPRLLSLSFMAGTGLVVFLFVRARTGRAGGAAAAGLFVLVERDFFARMGLAVCDYPAVFFSALGLYVWFNGGRWRNLAPLVFALAFFSKQSAVLAPLALVAGFLLSREWRRAGGFLALYAAFMGAGFLIAYSAFGPAYFINTFGYGVTGGFDLYLAVRAVGAIVALYPLFFVAAGAVAAGERGQLRIALSGYVLAGLVLTFLSGRSGGSRAYSFDLALALALSAGCAWPFFERFLERPLRPAVAAAVVGAVCFQASLVGAGVAREMNIPWLLTRAGGGWGEGRHAARRALYERGGMILGRYPGYEFGTPGRSFTTDPHRLSELFKAGVVDRRPLEEAVAEGAFSAVIVPAPQSSWGIIDDRLMRLVESRYEPIGQRDGEKYCVLRGDADNLQLPPAAMNSPAPNRPSREDARARSAGPR